MSAIKNTPALLAVENVSRAYQSGDTTVKALDGVSLTIHEGEFVAIMGQSGSGKSTLMNLLGCLDKPTGGSYHILGQNVSALDSDALARLRRETFGFIFQRYNLLSTATAAENVEIPAIYAGATKPVRVERAFELLAKLGLKGREDHRPGQLSGGQQQRVAVARALVNNPPVILADEPTGALDSASGKEVMALLAGLHAEGRTVILITHDEHVATHAHRLIRIQDGRILSDKITKKDKSEKPQLSTPVSTTENLPDVAEGVKMAVRSLKVNKFRTALTLLGIVIGVASVVTMMAVGNGSRQSVVDQISAMGTNLLSIRPGAPGMRSSGDIATLIPSDAEAITQVDNVTAVTPERSGRYTLRYGNTDYAGSVQGVGPDFIAVREWQMASGTFFTQADVTGYAPVAVLGQTTVTNLFGEGADPVGETILVRNVPFEVIGTLASKGAAMMGNDQDDTVVIPYSTGIIRLFGGNYLNNISVKVTDVSRMEETQSTITELLKTRHYTEDFSIRNMSSLLESASATQATLTLLLGTVAAISLLVGGIGVMNIMLVSVTERTREIGIRMATGARRADILVQFITEAAVVCTIGGLLGVLLGIGLALILGATGVNVLITPLPALLAFGCAFGSGLLFGYIPARKAAHLDPVKALSTE